MSIYIAVFFLQYAPLFGQGQLAKWPLICKVVIFVLACGPPVLLTMKLPLVLADFAVAANVETMQNLRFIEQVLRRLYTASSHINNDIPVKVTDRL